MKTLSPDALIVATRQELIAIITSQSAQIDTFTKQNNALTNTVTELTMQLEWFKRQVFGTKSERFIPADDLQMTLDLGYITNKELDSNPKKIPVSYDRKATSKPAEPLIGHGRGSMPTHLPVKEVVIEPEEDVTGLVKIGEEISWYYEMKEPTSLEIVKTIRPKYSLPGKNGVIIGALPALPVEKGNAGPGLLAHIITEKYLYHMPLDRQRKKIKNEYNVNFSESWLSDNVGKTVFWLEPVYNEYVKKLLSADYIQADETPLQVLTKDHQGKTHRGYLWVYHDPLQKIVIFDYRKSRSREGPLDFLKNFKGILQVDGYEGYGEIIRTNNLRRAACMDHIRRRFERALENDQLRAGYALDTMREWYKLEHTARENGLSFNERLAMRKESIAPSMETFKTWMTEQLHTVLPKSPLGVALGYALNQWNYFSPYLTDGRVELSNILIENAIRPVALGKKNFLFAGSHNAAKWPAVIYSLAGTALRHLVTPFNYFKELLTELPKISMKDIKKYLLPK